MTDDAQAPADDAHAELNRLLLKSRQLSSRALLCGKKYQGESDALAEEVVSILQTYKGLRKQAGTGKNRDRELAEKLKEVEDVLYRGPGGDLRQLLKSTKKPLILRALLGQHCPVQAVRQDAVFKCKQEYHAFRSRVARTMLILASLLVLAMRHARSVTVAHEHPDGSPRRFQYVRSYLPDLLRLQELSHHSFTPIIMVSVQGFLVYMTWIYLAMAARESLLLVNGSNIRPWWIMHHYLAAGTCLITITLPVESASVQAFVLGWLCWTIFQAILMMFQNAYQRKRMYTRIALGKDSAVDVVAGETIAVQGTLMMLIPALFVLQCWQVYMGAGMMLQSATSILDPEGWLELERPESDLRGLRGTFVVGMLMVFMGVMNAFFTLKTTLAKRRAAEHLRTRVQRPKEEGAKADKDDAEAAS